MSIQTQPGWKTHTPQDGSQIGGNQPTNAAWWSGPPLTGTPLTGTAAMLGVEGPAWATVEAYLLLPVIPSPALRLSFDLTVDAASLAALALIETDLLRLGGKTKQNYSMQRLFGKGIQIANEEGGWADIGFIPPGLPAGPSRHQIYYARDPLSGRYGTQAIVIDGTLHLVPPQFQGLAPLPSTWSPGEMIQIQITLGGTPGRAFIFIDNVMLEAC